MRHPGSSELSGSSAPGREADSSVSRPTPLTLVAGVVAGDDVASVAATVAAALHCPVAIAIPRLGTPVVAPDLSLDPITLQAVADRAQAAAEGARDNRARTPTDPVAEAVPVRIADAVVGIVAALAVDLNGSSAPVAAAERHAWLEAAASAASVIALIRDAHAGIAPGSEETELLAELATAVPEDLTTFVSRARRIGVELGTGAIALAARRGHADPGQDPDAMAPPSVGAAGSAGGGAVLDLSVRGETPALIAARGPGRVLALVPAQDGPDARGARELADRLAADGWTVSLSAPRYDAALLHEAVREAELLAELGRCTPPSPELRETYRLLIGVLLRDRAELEALRATTISPLADYDARHGTDLLATLQAFLTHDGSTTETADAMQLHRHTVGYRLSRVHEVSGLSPYESDGRERLSLGIKAREIFEAETRRRI